MLKKADYVGCVNSKADKSAVFCSAVGEVVFLLLQIPPYPWPALWWISIRPYGDQAVECPAGLFE